MLTMMLTGNHSGIGPTGVNWKFMVAIQLRTAFAGMASVSQNPAFDGASGAGGEGDASVRKLKAADQSLGAGVTAITRQK